MRGDHAGPKIAGAMASIFVLLLIGGVVTPAALEAQGPERRGGGMGPAMAGSVAFLLEKSDELGLSEEQDAGLTELVAEMRETNAPLMEQMEKTRGSGDRSAMQELMGTLRENDEASLKKGMALLDAEQTVEAQKLLDARPRRGRRPPG